MVNVFISSLLGHFSVDILNGTRSVLFTYLGVSMLMSNTQIGLFNTAYIFTTSLIQPVFGFFTDRFGSKLAIVGGILWMAFFFALGLLVPGVTGMVLIIIASLGSGAFHPAGTMTATTIGKKLFVGRETMTTSFFFLFGQLGHFIGPLAAGFLLNTQGSKGLLFVVAFLIPVAVYNAAVLKKNGSVKEEDQKPNANGKPEARVKHSSFVLILFASLAMFQSWTQANMVTYMPKYFSDMEKTPAEYGILTSLFMGGSALGNVLGGIAADRYGKRRTASIALSLAIIPIALIAFVGWTKWLYLLIPLAGMFTGATHSIIIVLAQRMFPNRMAFASGLILGFMFSSGSLGALFSGIIADHWGFQTMFAFTACIALIASLLTASLQKVDI